MMAWSNQHFPEAMRHLAPEVRAEAIDVANALLEEGIEERQAIRIAMANAKQRSEHASRRLHRSIERLDTRDALT